MDENDNWTVFELQASVTSEDVNVETIFTVDSFWGILQAGASKNR